MKTKRSLHAWFLLIIVGPLMIVAGAVWVIFFHNKDYDFRFGFLLSGIGVFLMWMTYNNLIPFRY